MESVRSVTSIVKSKFEDRLMEIYLRGGWASRMMKRLKGELDSTPSSQELNELFSRKTSYDDQKIRERLGYVPRFNIAEGISQTVNWLSLHELVRQSANPSATANALPPVESAQTEWMATQ